MIHCEGAPAPLQPAGPVCQTGPANLIFLRLVRFLRSWYFNGEKRWVDVMDTQTFKDTLGRAEPPAGLTPPLLALWHQARGKWEEAHRLVQDDRSESGAWVHAFLHRVEGDASNADYWYAVAGRPHYAGSLSSEWQEITGHLLGALAESLLEVDH